MDTVFTYQKRDILNLLRKKQDRLKSFGVSKIGLFGSYARESVHEQSDLDFYVEFVEGKKTFMNYMDLAFFLEDSFQKKIDLLTDKALTDRFRDEIEKDLEYVTISY